MELHELTLKEAAHKLRSKEFSAKELSKYFIDRIKKIDGDLHAFLYVAERESVKQAEEADRLLDSDISQLTGIPYAAKDNILVAGIQATAGSKILKNYIATYDATAIKKLKQSGPVLLGKTNLDEFAMGSSTENSAFGPSKNPYDLSRVPGGSSGGSAAAVASGEAIFALGTETGGSVRQPASFCGVVGLKPTYGRISRYGLVALGSSLDQMGIFTKTVEDAAIVLQQVAGPDENDSTALQKIVPDYQNFLKEDVKGMKVGIPIEYFSEGLDPEVKDIINLAIEKFEDLGAIIEETSLPHAKYALPAYYVILPVEISANLSRYDGIRYGLSVPGTTLEETYYNTRSAGFGAEPKRRAMIGTYASSAGYYDAYYKKAKLAQDLIRQDFLEAFKKYDFLLTPTCPTTAFKFGEKSDPLAMYLADIYTVGLNISGVPGLSVPAGATKDGLPVGIQIIAPHFKEEVMLHAGYAFQQATGIKLKPNI
ncbi:MAG: Asp-tRNA(Asn)/Glu-tRNA(Gln) amidotransferase subunit GatA [Candidatus Doudnabacteria bacterium]|nr:Asp-tRNA(Asn)/Glu-tRNA(Gln) amidotransferase subunit GatA [Candidatus Doudnabacteria bacterium]